MSRDVPPFVMARLVRATYRRTSLDRVARTSPAMTNEGEVHNEMAEL